VGGYFGGRLAQGGCDVGFVARGGQLRALRENGLRIESQLGELHIPRVRAGDDPAALGPADVVLICVKLWDTESAARAAAPIVTPETMVISLQNGISKEDTLRQVLGEPPVAGGLCYIGSKILRPGVIQHTGTIQKMIFGELDGGKSARTEAFLAACLRGGIDAEISPDIRRAIWEKCVFITGVSAVTTATRSPIGAIRSNSQTRAFLLDLMREVVAVGRALGINLPEDLAENKVAFCDSLPAEMTSSMHHDLQQGRRLEVPWLSGRIVELGKSVGAPTPLNRAVSDILALSAAGKV
jgi:2-dehydropantoate 2-reductase